MLLIPPDLIKSDRFSLGEKLLFILTRNPSALSIKEIRNVLHGRETRPYSYKGIQKALEILVEKGAVERLEGKERKPCYKYTVNINMVKRGYEHLKQFIQTSDQLQAIRANVDKEHFNHTIQVNGLFELDAFLEELEFYWLQHVRTTENMILCEQYFNRQSLSNSSRDTTVFKKLNIAYYVLCRKGFLSKKREGRWALHNVFIRQGVPTNTACDTQVMGDYIVTIEYPGTVIEKLEAILAGPIEIAARELHNIQNTVVVEIRKDKGIARQLRDRISKKFTDSEFKVMIEELKEQKEKSKPLSVNEKFHYVTSEQVKTIEYYDNQGVGILSSDDMEIKVLNDTIFSQIQKYLPHPENIAIIDLGVGPCVKPISILHKLATKFKTIEYVAVDYSKSVLKATSKHLSRHVFTGLKPRFINMDFLQLASNPSLLLNEIVSPHRIFLLIGSTYGIFDVQQAKAMLKNILRPGDLLVIDIETVNNQSELEQIWPRYNKEKALFNMQPFYNLGFSLEDFTTRFQFNEKTREVQLIATVKNLPAHLPSAIQDINLSVGESIKVFSARKPTKEQFFEELKSLAKNVKVSLHNEGSYYLAYCHIE